jgi:hypothetical protein
MGNRQTDALHYTLLPPVPGTAAALLRAVAWELAWAADNGTGKCFLSYRGIASRLGMEKCHDAVIRAVDWLDAIGFLRRYRKTWADTGANVNNDYFLREVIDVPEEAVGNRGGVKCFEGWVSRVEGSKAILFAHPAWATPLPHPKGRRPRNEAPPWLKRVVAENDLVVAENYQGGSSELPGWWFRTTRVVAENDQGGSSELPKPFILTLHKTLEKTLQQGWGPPPTLYTFYTNTRGQAYGRGRGETGDSQQHSICPASYCPPSPVLPP